MPITKLDEKAALIIFDQQNYNRALDVDSRTLRTSSS
jgi:hypothetical protein